MIDPVVIDFQVRGITEVGRAMDTVNQRLAQMERHGIAQSEAGAKARVRSAQSEAKAKEAAEAKVAREKARIEKQVTRDKEAEDKRRRGIVQRSSEIAGQYAAKLAKDEANAEKQKTRDLEREEARRLRIRRESSRMAGQLAVREAAEEATTRRRIASRVTGSLGHMVSGAGRLAAMGLGLGGGAFIVDSARREMSAEREAALLVNQVTLSGHAPAGANVKNIVGQARQVARETGMDASEVIAGTRAYAKTARGGDFSGAMSNMGFFAKMSLATGTDMSEISGAAGMLQSQNAALAKDPAKMRQMLLDIYEQTKHGSLGMTEFISQAGDMGSVRSAFAGDESVNQRKLFALGQLVAPAAGAESGIMIKNLALEVLRGKHLEAAKSMGVKFDSLNRMQSPDQMIEAVMRSTGGDISKIQNIFGNRGGTLLRELAGGYSAARKTGGVAGGEAYLKSTIGSVAGATGSEKDLNAMVGEVTSTPGKKIEMSVNKVRQDLEEKLAPALEDFADNVMPKLMPVFDTIVEKGSEFAKWFADNPIKGIGAVVLGSITKDLASAGIGATVKVTIETILAQMMAGRAAGSVASGAAGAAAGVVGKAGAVIGVAGIAAGLTAYAIAADVETQQNKDKSQVGRMLSDTNLAAKIRSGKATVADIAKAQAEVSGLGAEAAKQGDVAHGKGLLGGRGFLEESAVLLAKLTARGSDADELIHSKQHAAALAYDNLTKTAKELDAALRNVASTAANRSIPINERTPSGS